MIWPNRLLSTETISKKGGEIYDLNRRKNWHSEIESRAGLFETSPLVTTRILFVVPSLYKSRKRFITKNFLAELRKIHFHDWLSDPDSQSHRMPLRPNTHDNCPTKKALFAKPSNCSFAIIALLIATTQVNVGFELLFGCRDSLLNVFAVSRIYKFWVARQKLKEDWRLVLVVF